MNGGLQFHFLGVPVRVVPMFFLTTFLLGGRSGDPTLLVAWMGIVFVSILLHEMGHALMFRAFGVRPTIEIHGFGGTTSGRSLPVGRDLLVSLAGPAAGLAVGLPALVMFRAAPQDGSITSEVLWMIVWVNFFWSLVNLLPLLPLDGGNATNALLSLLTRRDTTRVVQVLSIVTATAVIAFCLANRFIYGALLGGWFCFLNIRALSQPHVSTRMRPTVHNAPRRRDRGSPAPSTPSGPPTSWKPTAGAGAPISDTGWVQPAPRGRTFSQELETASVFLDAGQPEMALIAAERAKRMAQDPDEHAVAEQLAAEIGRRITGPAPTA